MGWNTIETRLENFHWSVRTLNVFRAYSITTIADLLSMSDDELLALQNFGRESLYEVKVFKARWEKRALSGGDNPRKCPSVRHFDTSSRPEGGSAP